MRDLQRNDEMPEMQRDDAVLVAGPRHLHVMYVQGRALLGVRRDGPYAGGRPDLPRMQGQAALPGVRWQVAARVVLGKVKCKACRESGKCRACNGTGEVQQDSRA